MTSAVLPIWIQEGVGDLEEKDVDEFIEGGLIA
jgi:hypothetical protein